MPDDAGPSDFATAPWSPTASGRVVDLLNPDPASIDAGDIAVGLARMPRFAGQTRADRLAWSVAEHSLLVEALAGAASPYPPGSAADTDLRDAALLHDAHEYLIGDITTPVQFALRHFTPGHDGVAALKHRLQAAIHARFGLAWPLPPQDAALIKTADRQALALEKAQFMLDGPRTWPDMLEPPAGITIGPLPERPSAQRFERRMIALRLRRELAA